MNSESLSEVQQGTTLPKSLTLFLFATLVILLSTCTAFAQVLPPVAPIVTDQSALNLSNNFGRVGNLVSNAAGDVAFIDAQASAVFLQKAGTPTPIRLFQSGDPVPGVAGAHADYVIARTINSSGSVLFTLVYETGGVLANKALVSDGTSLKEIADSAQVAVGGIIAGGSTLLNDAGDATFALNVQGVTTKLYIAPAGSSPVVVAAVGAAVPGGQLQSISPAIFVQGTRSTFNNNGELLFSGTVNGNGGLYVASIKNGIRKIAANGDQAPGGGVFDSINLNNAAINNLGQVAFIASVTTPSQRGIWISDPTLGLTEIASTLMTTPVPGGGTYGAPFAPVQINDEGDVVFPSTIIGNTTTNFAIFRGQVSGAATQVVTYRGESAPGVTGANFVSFLQPVSINSTGAVAFATQLSNGQNAVYTQSGVNAQGGSNAPTLIAIDGQASGDGGNFSLAGSRARIVGDSTVVFTALETVGPAFGGLFHSGTASFQKLVNSNDPLPPGARISMRNGYLSSAGSLVPFFALQAGGSISAFVVNSGSGAITKIASDGDPMPGIAGARLILSGGVFGGGIYANSAGAVALDVNLAATGSKTAVLQWTSASGLTKLVAEGDIDPVTGQTLLSPQTVATFSGDVSQSPINSQGTVLISTNLSSGQNALYLVSAGSNPSKVIATGDTIGGVTVLNLNNDGNLAAPQLNANGQVAFNAVLSDGSHGLYLTTPGGAPAKIVKQGDSGPNGPNGPTTFSTIPGFFSLNNSGEVAFFAGYGPLTNGVSSAGVFIGSASAAPQSVALDGAPAPSGGNFSIQAGSCVNLCFEFVPNDVLINDEHDVAFSAALASGNSDSGYFLRRGAQGALQTVALQGQPAPGTNFNFTTFTTPGGDPLDTGVPGYVFSLGPNGQLAFQNEIPGQTLGAVVPDLVATFFYGTDNSLTKVIAPGDSAPGTSGGQITLTSFGPGLVNGLPAFWAATPGGATASAIFVQEPVLTITPNQQAVIYSGAIPTGLTYTVSPNVPLDTPATCTAASKDVGIAITVICSGASKAGYQIVYAPGTVNITPAPVTVTANNASKFYGDPVPTLTYTVTGLVAGDILSGAPTLLTTATATSPVGTYPIIISQGTLSTGTVPIFDYLFTFVNGTLQINPAPPIASPALIEYLYAGSSTTPNLGAWRIDSLSGALTPVGVPFPVPAPSTALVADTLSRSLYVTSNIGGTLSAYPIDRLTGSLTVPAQVSLGVPGASQAAEDPTGTFLYADSIANQQLFGFGLTQPNGAPFQLPSSGFLQPGQIYKILVHPNGKYLYVGDGEGNRVFSYGIQPSGTLIPLSGSPSLPLIPGTNTAVIDPFGRFLYVGHNPSGEITEFRIDPVSGNLIFVNGSIVLGASTVSLAIDPRGRFLFVSGSDPTTGAITTMTLSIDQTSGMLTPISVPNKPSGNPVAGGGPGAVIDATGNFLYTGCTSCPTISAFSIDQGSGALSQPVVFQAFGVNPVMAIALANNPTTVTVAASPNPVAYGQSATLTATVVTSTGLPISVGTVTFTDTTTAAALGTATLNSSGQASVVLTALSVGTHTITASYPASPSFPASSGSTSVTITPAVLTVTADSKSKVYGEVVPALTATITGLLSGDIVSGTPALSTVVAPTTSPGTYPIIATQGSLFAANYTFAFANGTLTVTPAASITLPPTNPGTPISGGAVDTYVTPFGVSQNGFITAWQTVFPTTNLPASVQLDIFRSNSSGGLQVVAQGQVHNIFTTTAGVVTFNEAPIPVLAGDLLGITIVAGPSGGFSYPAAGPAGTLVVPGSVSIGQNISPGAATVPNPPPLSFTLAPASTSNPLKLMNNFFVTGDYSTASVTLRGTGVNGVATGTITMPTFNPTAGNGIPDGADVVGAYLYWETLENTAMPSANNGTFRGYSISGQKLGNDAQFQEGNLTGMMRVYRADVLAYLPLVNGVRVATGSHTVTLPDGFNALPLTEGATLVVIYRVMSPNFPLKAVVIYDGSAAPTTPALQIIQGFYDAAPVIEGPPQAKTTSIFTPLGGSWYSASTPGSFASASEYTTTLIQGAWAAMVLSTPVNNPDNDGILGAWKRGPTNPMDFHFGQPGYYGVKYGQWIPLPGAMQGQKDLFVQMDYMCSNVLADGTCDPAGRSELPSIDAQGRDPFLAMQQFFANRGIALHLLIGNAIQSETCTDNPNANPPQLCEFPGEPGVVNWKVGEEIFKVWPRNPVGCASGGDCSPRLSFDAKDSYHYVLMADGLAIPAWNTTWGTLTSITVANGVTTIVTPDRGTGINACPNRVTITGALGNPALNGVYNVSTCNGTTTSMTLSTPGVPNWSYPNNTLAEPVLGVTSGTISSISGFSDLGGADSVISLGKWETSPNQDMSKRFNVQIGTILHEIGHTLSLPHGGRYFDTPGSYRTTYDANCKPNYQSLMNYEFQLDGVGPNHALDFSGQTLNTIDETHAGSTAALTDVSGFAATYPTSSWYTPVQPSGASPALRHCDGTVLTGDTGYRIDGAISPISPAWIQGFQDVNFDGQQNAPMRGYNDWANLDLRQVGATSGQFATIANLLSFGDIGAPLNVGAGGSVTLGSGGSVILGSGGSVTMGSGGSASLSNGATIALNGGSVTLSNGGTVTLSASGTITMSNGGNVILGSAGAFTLGSSGGTVTMSGGGMVTLAGAGSVTLGSGGTILLGSGGTVVLGAGGNYTLNGSGGTIILGSGGNVTFGSGGNIAMGSGGSVLLGSGGSILLGSGGTVALGGAGSITMGSGGNVIMGSGGNIILGSGGSIIMGSGGNVTMGSGGNVTLGSGGTVILGSGGNVALGSAGNLVMGSGGTVNLGSGGSVTVGSGGNVTMGSAGTINFGSGGSVTIGAGGNVTMGSAGSIILGSGGNIVLGAGGTVTMGSGGLVTLSSGGNVALGSGGNLVLGAGGSYTASAGDVITLGGAGGSVLLGSGGTLLLGSGGSVILGSGGTIVMGSGGNILLGSGGNVTFGSGGTITMGSGGNVIFGSGGNTILGSGGTVSMGSGGSILLGSGGNVTQGGGGTLLMGSGGNTVLGSGGTLVLGSGGSVTLGSGGTQTLGAGGTFTFGSGGSVILGSGGTLAMGSGGNTILGSGGTLALGSGGNTALGSGGTTALGSGGAQTSSEITYETANAVARPPSLPTLIRTNLNNSPAVVVNWTPPVFGVVTSYTVFRSDVGQIGTVTGTPPPTTFTDPHPSGVQTVTYTISSGVVGDTQHPILQSPPSVPALLTQTITFGPLPNAHVNDLVPVSATASSGLPVQYTTAGNCALVSQTNTSPTTGTVQAAAVAGSCKVTAAVAAQGGYAAAMSVSQTFSVTTGTTKFDQVITFPPLGTETLGNPDFTLVATASSNLPVSYTANGACTVNGSTLHITGVGSCSVTASQNGNADYNPAQNVTRSFMVLYATGTCDGAPGHTILPPINSDGSSVFKQGRTVPVQFRVCDAKGVSIGTQGVVSSFQLTGIYNGTVSTLVETVSATNNDTAFRWDSSNQQWIFNLSTSNLAAGKTYIYTIKLNDGTIVSGMTPTLPPPGTASFQFGLR